MDNKKMVFEYRPEIHQRFPEARAGVILGRGLSNPSAPPDLVERFGAEQKKVLAEIGETPLSEINSLAAWRSAFRRFGVNPTKYRSAGEALLRRLTKKGDIPSVNTLVDIGNLVSIRYRLPVAIFDVAQLAGQISVQTARGDEKFTPLFEEQEERPEAGEVIFLDASGVVVARRWCWRQSDESAARETTRDVIITTEGLHPNTEEEIQAALADLSGLLAEFAGGRFASGFIGPGMLVFSG